MTYVTNFMLDDNGKVVQIRYIKKKRFTTGRGFPIIAEEVGLVLVDAETQKVVAKFSGDKKKYGIIDGGYPLDSHRIAFQFVVPRKPVPKRGTAVWDLRTNAISMYDGKMNREFSDVPAVHPLLTHIITLPYSETGLLLHDLTAGTSVPLFKEWFISYPRFSPDGSRYAFFAGPRHEPNMLLIQQLRGGSAVRVKMERQAGEKSLPAGRTLAWSPSGKFLAGVVFHDWGRTMLYVWNGDGSLVTRVPLKFSTGYDWAPLWSADETELLMFESELMPGEKDKDAKPLAMHKIRVR